MIEIHPERLLADLAVLRSIGAVGSGVVRQALTQKDLEGRRWLAHRYREARLEPAWDCVGNLFGISPGDSPTLLIGSHSDTQPEGGWLDGAYGVICGLEIARAAREAGVNGVSAVSFSDEEGLFAPLLGSRYWTGELPLTEALAAKDPSGRTLSDVLMTVPEVQGAAHVSASRFRGYIEPHVEQGPVLYRALEDVGVVTAIAGMRQLEISFVGEQNHAGATPMADRRDALQGFVDFVASLNAEFRSLADPGAVWTIGRISVHPNAPSIIPGEVKSILQIRDVASARLDAMAAYALDLAEQSGRRSGVVTNARLIGAIAPAAMDGALTQALATAAEVCAPGRWRLMPSGALHDAGVVSRILPSAMVFTPSLEGKSHSFDEDTREEHLVLACRVLATTVGTLVA